MIGTMQKTKDEVTASECEKVQECAKEDRGIRVVAVLKL